MDRIAKTFNEAKSKGRSCFVSYICAGDPTEDVSLEICRTLVEEGVDIMELGVPFSDPVADGLTNQLAAERALSNGMTQEKVFNLVRNIRKFSEVPIVLYTYYNLVLSLGIENYVKRAKEAGVDGLLTLDCPPEEGEELLEVCRRHGLANIFIVAPTTPPERMELIAKVATGFIYYVSLTGVTGERSKLADDIGDIVSELKTHTDLPVVVGFGISTEEHVRSVAALADGVVVGSALVNCVGHNPTDHELIISKLRAKMRELVKGLE